MSETRRRGRIDELGDLRDFDVIAFNGGVNPYGNAFAEGGFKGGAQKFRDEVAQWGFTGLGKVADVGAGYGRWSVFLAEANDSVVGFEWNEEAVKLARKLCEHFGLDNASFEVADVTALKAESGQFDGVWCYNTMQFVDRQKTLTEINRILKPGGRLFLGVYNGVGRVIEKFFQGYRAGGVTQGAAKFALRGMKEGPMYDGKGNYASPEVIEEVLKRHGFKLLQEPKMDVEMSRKPRKPTPFDGDMKDLKALAQRLETDAKFAGEFAQHPEVATLYPINLHFCAVKT
jgi:ubiquinone/menaquinone biosynthesis C-methylase UbiE